MRLWHLATTYEKAIYLYIYPAINKPIEFLNPLEPKKIFLAVAFGFSSLLASICFSIISSHELLRHI